MATSQSTVSFLKSTPIYRSIPQTFQMYRQIL